MQPPRARLHYALLLTLTVALGLASRKFLALLPPLLAKDAGDILYATMAFWLIGLLFPRLSTANAALFALLFCVAIEFLKFAQVPSLVAARASRVGALVFGRGFHVSNLVCYALGVGLGVSVEAGLKRALRRRV